MHVWVFFSDVQVQFTYQRFNLKGGKLTFLNTFAKIDVTSPPTCSSFLSVRTFNEVFNMYVNMMMTLSYSFVSILDSGVSCSIYKRSLGHELGPGVFKLLCVH